MKPLSVPLFPEDIALIREALLEYREACLQAYEVADGPKEAESWIIARDAADALRDRLATVR